MTTLRSEGSSAPKKDLTGPTLLEMSGYPTTQELARFLLDSLNSGKLPVYVRFFAKST